MGLKYWFCGLLLFFPLICQGQSLDQKDHQINSETIAKGYTFYLENKRFKLGMTPAVIDSDSAAITLKREDNSPLPLVDNISPVYSYDLVTSSSVNLNKPLWVKIKTKKFTAANQDVILKYWDNNKGDWTAIPSTFNQKKRVVKAAIHLTYAQLAVFAKEKDYQIGTATWYDWYDAASNDYPMGTKLRVTNTDNHKTVDVTVVSTGPFTRHIIDLPMDAFSALGDLDQGILNVKVQPI